jgi:hypothetical protein
LSEKDTVSEYVWGRQFVNESHLVRILNGKGAPWAFFSVVLFFYSGLSTTIRSIGVCVCALRMYVCILAVSYDLGGKGVGGGGDRVLMPPTR